MAGSATSGDAGVIHPGAGETCGRLVASLTRGGSQDM